jgi:hypothetical protein
MPSNSFRCVPSGEKDPDKTYGGPGRVRSHGAEPDGGIGTRIIFLAGPVGFVAILLLKMVSKSEQAADS